MSLKHIMKHACGSVQASQAVLVPTLPAVGTLASPTISPPSQVPVFVSWHCQVTYLLSVVLRLKTALREEKDSGVL